MSSTSLLQSLNQEQHKAVTYTNGPLLIIAGAGTGKTTVITHKIAWLIEQSLAKPTEILALTFTDKAATEMEERVDKLVPYGLFDLWISTFHSFGQRILELHALDIGLTPDFRLLATTDSWLLIRKNLHKFNLDYYRPLGNPTKFIHALIKLFSRLKDEGITPAEYLRYAENLTANQDNTMAGDTPATLGAKQIMETASAYFQYQQLLVDNNLLDFGDLIYYTNKLFADRPNILANYQQQFKYILIDEFQDTNLAQYQLIKCLTNPQSNLTVVGDDDQSIFKFRGASVSNILNFKRDFPAAKKIVLTANYRSSQNILDLAYNFIQHNNPDRLEFQLNHPDKYYSQAVGLKTEKIDKKLFAATPDAGLPASLAGQIEFKLCRDELAEVSFIIAKIQSCLLSDRETNLNDFAILLRANRQADLFKNALEQAKMSYLFVASQGLFLQPVINDLLAYCRALLDPADSISLARVLAIPGFDLPEADLLKLNYWHNRKKWTFQESLDNVRAIPEMTVDAVTKIEQIMSQLVANAKVCQNLAATEMLVKILHDTRYREHILALEQTAPAKARAQCQLIKQFLKKCVEYSQIYDDRSLKGFIEHINLVREAGDTGALNYNVEDIGPEALKIMTIHSAKGLEFKYVFIPGLAHLRFPTINRGDAIELPTDLIKEKEILPEGDEHLEEERRLFYVGLTRAKRGLFLTCALDYGGRRQTKPSLFLFETQILKSGDQLRQDDGLAGFLRPALETDTTVQPFIYPLPKEFSYSQIAAYEKCPLQYKYQFILKIPQDKGKATLSFGRTMHQTMLAIFRLTNMRCHASQSSLFGATGVAPKDQELITLAEIMNIYAKNWQDDWFETAQQKQDYLAAGKKILREFYNQHHANWPRPRYLEEDFRVKLDQFAFKGRIDRIDLLPDASGIEIIDYKTGKLNPKPVLADKIQLLLYQIALAHHNPPPKKLTFYHLNHLQQGSVSFIGTENEMEKVKNKLIVAAQKIKQRDFKATPNRHVCQFCDFKNICPDSAI
ncbi:MAG: hypothetical protein A2445_04095 [Candidatus Jacksonbacteria bacterium RIFOXYC2_FULL_44_29]|nr:MAG: hypothetical protein UV19_C0001G0036 [Parcubacteria group bacterium GW2011_GWA2_42_28]KKT56231.1 MAG: hypothetical protein UW45_C0001G0035 [Parcubacteria group bacterium GW2011_GWC2_44_22]OGY76121.1 MAG: hypothetical protein A2240_00315 [Candidatus Jacksonbacteria bacterium RIFOXYA2_FULL_43_12]OGY77712.1 MAG: hypothetical protein A2295_02815 [Candidatus Jacksonbacteria bacterium RIFOXYB2_FULL_44_15]OGY78848.1 MAG: hypothetical protein A2550_04880 [Candidatus Jacksonbacteria bacterium RI